MTVRMVEGGAEDFLVELQTELGAEIQASVLEHVSIDDRKLATEAEDLPQLIFYYTATYQRMTLRLEQARMKVKEVEAQERIRLIEEFRSRGDRIAEIEQNARLDLDPNVKACRSNVLDLSKKCEIVKGILSSLTRKGFSLQMVAQMRAREEQWLAQSFGDRLRNSPHQLEIQKHLSAISGLM